MLRRVQDGKPVEVQYRVIWPDASVHWVECKGVYLRDSDGNALRLLGVVIDITDRKRTEDTLRFLAQSGAAPTEDFFLGLARFLAQTLDMDYVCIDRLHEGLLAAQTLSIYFDGKFDNNVSYTLKDTPCGDVVGKTVCTFPKGVRHLFPKDVVLQEMLAESYVGTTLWSSAGKPIGLIALIGRKPLADTKLVASILQLAAVRAAGELDRRQAEEALRQSEARFKAIASSTPDHILVQDRDLRYLFVVNPQLDLTERVMIGKTDHDFLAKEDADRLTQIKRQVLETGQPVQLEAPIASADGGQQFFSGSFVPRFTDAGEIDGLIGYFQNITERKKRENDLYKAQPHLASHERKRSGHDPGDGRIAVRSGGLCDRRQGLRAYNGLGWLCASG